MRPRQLAAAALLMLLTSAPGRACDSYDDDMSLASVLAQAVAQARADGTLQLPLLANEAGAPEQPLPAALGGGAAVVPKS